MQKTYLSIGKWMKPDEGERGKNETDEKYIPISIPASSVPGLLSFSIISRGLMTRYFAIGGRVSAG
jgi:hypothetical protein